MAIVEEVVVVVVSLEIEVASGGQLQEQDADQVLDRRLPQRCEDLLSLSQLVAVLQDLRQQLVVKSGMPQKVLVGLKRKKPHRMTQQRVAHLKIAAK